MEETALQLLRSNKPSHRWVAIDRLRHEGTVADLDELRIALQVEAVPMLRKQLSLMIRRLSSSGTKKLPRVQRADHPGPSGAFQDDVIHWMRHELEPGIGWLLLAASDEVPDFDGSETRAAIDGLWMRLNSIESLVRASAPPRLESVSLSEVVFGAVRISGEKHDRVGIDISSDKSDDILTDGDLLRLVLSNAIRNALEAIREIRVPDVQVYVSADVASSTFWVKVSNQFVGTEFSLDDVSGSGVTAKIGHQGQGFGIMRIAAERLGYDIDMRAEGGHAVFTLRGSREGV